MLFRSRLLRPKWLRPIRRPELLFAIRSHIRVFRTRPRLERIPIVRLRGPRRHTSSRELARLIGAKAAAHDMRQNPRVKREAEVHATARQHRDYFR